MADGTTTECEAESLGEAAAAGRDQEPARQRPAGSTMMSANAEFLFSAVFKEQHNAEVARRFYPMLRQWAETKKSYRGHTFTAGQVEEVISACERKFAGPAAQVDLAKGGVTSKDASKESMAEMTRHAADSWWPRWVLDMKRGVEVLAPVERGKVQGWVLAKPVAIGYHGQKRRYLFVRAPKFEMDCRRSEVRKPGGGRTVEELAQELLARGDDPACHPDWTDGTDVAADGNTGPADMCIAPGIAPSEHTETRPAQLSSETAGGTFGNRLLVEELEGDFERMALLRRSSLVKTRTCDHPDPLAEPRAAASLRLPALTESDIVALPVKTAEERLSSLQLETVCFAARRFRQALPDGRAAGYMLGDGTGCGKGRCISAMLCHLWNLGHRRSVWVSATSDLYYDACRDLQDLGADIPCMPMRRLPPSGPLDLKDSEANRELVRHFGIEGNGVIFLTYSLLVQTGQRRYIFAAPVHSEESRRLLLGGLLDERLRCIRAAPEFGDEGKRVDLQAGDRVVGVKSLRELQAREVPFTVSFERVLQQSKGGQEDSNEAGSDYTAWNSRLGQLVSWLGGSDASGLICFDEVHKAKNLVPDKDDRASTKTGLFVDLLQQHCPKAPVLYVSATAATEVQHLGYMSRLGVWGTGTAFENFHDFMKTIESNGVSAMEMFAMNMKAIGALSCRSLAYVGTEFVTQQCGLTEAQTAMYNTACKFWQTCLFEFRRFVDSKELIETYRKRFFKRMKKQALEGEGAIEIGKRLWQFFWGAQQRFFKAMCNSLKVPFACAAAKEAVERGEQVVLSIWATGEARSRARMADLKDETPGRIVIDSVSEGGIVEAEVGDGSALERLASCLYANLRLKNDVHLNGKLVGRMSRLQEVHGRRISRPEDLLGAALPVRLLFRAPTTRRLAVDAVLAGTQERVRFELGDDALGERALVVQVLEGPAVFRRAQQEGWHVKTVNDRPIGKTQVRHLRQRLRKGVSVAFQDAVIPEHLSAPKMILEHFLSTSLLTQDEKGEELPWAIQTKESLLAKARALELPANAMDEIIDHLGGMRKVGEMSGRSHRMKRRKDGSLAYVARCEELRCTHGGANMVEQVLFQKGAKKICLVTEVASAGISLHADRRQVRKDFQPPRRTMISVELPWGADKAIQCFGRVHRANQLIPPRFIMLTTPLGGEVRFISAIARRMKLLGAVTKGDRMTSMGGGADRHMADFDVNNAYGQHALETLYLDTTSEKGTPPELLALYEGLPFIGEAAHGEATGLWPRWADFASEVRHVWGRLNLREEMAEMMDTAKQDRVKGGCVRESDALNRFFNRIFMLEVQLQNALFETFFAVYSELVRIDCTNGTYDDGVENLNQSQGRRIRQIEADRREILYTDPVSGAETQYLRLCLDRGITWEEAQAAHDALDLTGVAPMEGFYAFRRTPGEAPVYIFVKEWQQLGGAGGAGSTWAARRRRKQYVVWRADSGTCAGQEVGRHTFSAEDFADERYERVPNDTAGLERVRDGWTRLYKASTESRLQFEHLLTGDVLSAWRLTAASTKRRGGDGSGLKIVRAITQPGDVPIVGMRVAEGDLPQLKYVLGCQHASSREDAKTAPDRPSVRDVCIKAADAFLARLSAAGGSLKLASWLDLHKQLAADEAVPRSVDGLRGVQQAVELLTRRGFITASEGVMEVKNTVGRLTAESLEMKLFPEEFCASDKDEDGSSQSSGTDGEASGADEGTTPADNLHDLGRLDPYSLEKPDIAPESNHAGSSLVASPKRSRKRKGTSTRAVPTPAKARKSRQTTESSKSLVTKMAKGRRRKDRGSGSLDEAGETLDENAMFDELFGSEAESEDANEDTAPPEHGSTVEAMRTEAPRLVPTLKRPREDVAKAPCTKPTEEATGGVSRGEPRIPSDGPGSRTTWTYEVIGNKLGIRKVPDAENTKSIGYLTPGEFFNVTEQVGGKDGRTYLRLADGRGWAYDRSAKDISKVVVRLIKTQ